MLLTSFLAFMNLPLARYVFENCGLCQTCDTTYLLMRLFCKQLRCISNMSSDNPDIRQQVKEQSGSLKRLQTKVNLEQLRRQIANSADYTNLTLVGSAISQLQQFAGELRHSEQGYSGLAPSISITEQTLNKLYDYDYAFVQSAYDLLNATSSFNYDPSAPN